MVLIVGGQTDPIYTNEPISPKVMKVPMYYTTGLVPAKTQLEAKPTDPVVGKEWLNFNLHLNKYVITNGTQDQYDDYGSFFNTRCLNLAYKIPNYIAPDTPTSFTTEVRITGIFDDIPTKTYNDERQYLPPTDDTMMKIEDLGEETKVRWLGNGVQEFENNYNAVFYDLDDDNNFIMRYGEQGIPLRIAIRRFNNISIDGTDKYENASVMFIKPLYNNISPYSFNNGLLVDYYINPGNAFRIQLILRELGVQDPDSPEDSTYTGKVLHVIEFVAVNYIYEWFNQDKNQTQYHYIFSLLNIHIGEFDDTPIPQTSTQPPSTQLPIGFN